MRYRIGSFNLKNFGASATIREYCFILEITFQAGARFDGYLFSDLIPV